MIPIKNFLSPVTQSIYHARKKNDKSLSKKIEMAVIRNKRFKGCTNRGKAEVMSSKKHSKQLKNS